MTTRTRRRGTAAAGAVLLLLAACGDDDSSSGDTTGTEAPAVEPVIDPGDGGDYAPDLEGAPMGSLERTDPDRQVYVIVVDRFLTPAGAKTVGDALAGLEEHRGPPQRMERPNIVIWRFG